jgi:hypothetical protein
LGLLLPLVLVARGAWTAILAAGLTVAGLVVVSLLLFGSAPWLDYWANTLPYQQRVMLEPYGFVWTLMAAPFAFAYKIGLDVPTALKLHVVLTIFIVGPTLLAVRHCTDWPLTIAIVALASVLATPYALNYDLAIPAAALLFYLASRTEPFGRPELAVIGAFWFMPYAAMGLDVLAGIPVSAPLSMCLLAVLLREALNGRRALARPAATAT